jgi:O-antigen/teichoic acid export membrane protein
MAGQTAGSGACALLDQAIASAANFASGVIVGRACVKDEFGAYILGLNIVLFLVAVQHSIIITPYTVYAPRFTERARQRYTGSALLLQLGICLGAIGVFLLMGLGVRWAPDGDALMPVMIALAGGAAFVLLKEHARGICFAQLRMGVALVFDVVAGAAQVAGLLICVRLGWLSAGVACAVLGLASCLAAAGWLWWMRGRFAFRLSAVWFDLRRNWLLGRWVLASNLVWSLVTYIYPWLLVIFHDVGDGGAWGACLGIVGLINPILLGIQNSIGPNIAHAYAHGDRSALRRRALRACGMSAAVLAPVVPVLFLFGEQLVTLVYGAQYHGQHLVVSLLGVNMFLGGIGFAFSRALFALEQAVWDLAGNLAGLAALLLTGMWLAKGLGPLGLACGMLTCTVAATGVRLVAFAWLSAPERTADATPTRAAVLRPPHHVSQPTAACCLLAEEPSTEGSLP